MNTSSTWVVNAGDDCDVDGKKKAIESKLWVGTQNPTNIELSSDCFCGRQQSNLDESAANCISIMALGWCYVLSARMIELNERKGAKILYTGSVATRYQEAISDASSSQAVVVDCFEEERDTARWWAAILAPT